MNKKIVILIILIFIEVSSLLAQNIATVDTARENSGFYQSIFNLRPVLIGKGKMLLNAQLEFPRYYKVYNPTTNALSKLPSVMVLNEFYFNSLFTYGLSDRWNIYINVPFVDIHHYSPMVIQSGIGIGDMQLGADY